MSLPARSGPPAPPAARLLPGPAIGIVAHDSVLAGSSTACIDSGMCSWGLLELPVDLHVVMHSSLHTLCLETLVVAMFCNHHQHHPTSFTYTP